MTATRPQLSVIIADVNGPPMIDACLSALSRQNGNVDAEVIVAESTGDATAAMIGERFPWVKVLPFAERLTIPQLRTEALAESRGDIVAVIEDHCEPDENWYEEMVSAHAAHPNCVAVGGSVENGRRDRLMDWAVFFAEYSPFMKPIPRGRMDGITGNNVSYKRAAFEGLNGIQSDLRKGFWESTLHSKLLERGDHFVSEPDVTVYHSKHFGVRYALSQRFHYSRYYAGTLFGTAGLPTRLFRGAASLILPAVLLPRIVRGVIKKRRNLRELILATPILAVITGVWAFGEMVGSLFGPGQSLSKIE